MKIATIEVEKLEMPLREPYTIAYETVTNARNVVVRIVLRSGAVGLGCAAPEPEITGEDFDETCAALEEAGRTIRGKDARRRQRLIEILSRGVLAGRPSALAAIDMALWDLIAKAAGLPLWQLLGGYRDRIRTSITLGITPLDETVAAAQARVNEGFSCIKLKGGANAEDDVARVLAVRAAVGERIELRFDANQGFTEREAKDFVERVRSARLTVLEQPTPRESRDVLGRVTRDIELPVMADESLVTLRDAFDLARRRVVDMVNVKLMKVGGITRALQVAAVARAAGLEVMVGCMDESALSIAAGLAYCLATPVVRYADLDGHLDLQNDPFAATLSLRKGVLYASPLAGLGYEQGA